MTYTMKKEKTIMLLLLIAGITAVSNAQSGVTVQASQLYTTFKFWDSSDNALKGEYSGIFTRGFGLGYRYLTSAGVFVDAGFGINKAGATMVYDDSNYKWDLHYAGLKLGGGYMLQGESISPFIGLSGYFSFLLTGFQTINNEDFDIKEARAIKKNDFGIIITPGIQLSVSQNVSAFAGLNYIMGLQNLEYDEEQKAKNSAFGLTLGFSLFFIKQ